MRFNDFKKAFEKFLSFNYRDWDIPKYVKDDFSTCFISFWIKYLLKIIVMSRLLFTEFQSGYNWSKEWHPKCSFT